MAMTERQRATQNFEKVWERGMLVENFKFDKETERKLERFKEFLFANLSYECVLSIQDQFSKGCEKND
jgi:hypothetical protein